MAEGEGNAVAAERADLGPSGRCAFKHTVKSSTPPPPFAPNLITAQGSVFLGRSNPGVTCSMKLVRKMSQKYLYLTRLF